MFFGFDFGNEFKFSNFSFYKIIKYGDCVFFFFCVCEKYFVKCCYEVSISDMFFIDFFESFYFF